MRKIKIIFCFFNNIQKKDIKIQYFIYEEEILYLLLLLLLLKRKQISKNRNKKKNKMFASFNNLSSYFQMYILFVLSFFSFFF